MTMYAAERQQAMAELVTRRGRVSVADLAVRFGVTTETVRRDLDTLEGMRLVRRVHGGALPAESFTALEAGLGDRGLSHPEEKRRIAQAAVAFLPESEATVIIDAGTTTILLAGLLPRERTLTVLTHSVPVAARLADLPNVELYLLPGRVRHTTQAAVGVETVAALGRVRAEVAFLGTNGISLDHGLSTPDHAEAATKSAIVACAQKVVVLADSSKLGQERTVRFADLTDIDVLVTDEGAADQIESFRSAGVEVVTA
ncbi:MAG TPA: DeoR/GlpR family DNA-binding transcription regulator [Nocardioides sp.]|uniref:DeoR/GlpR family DNA-binding transcription regulator n=1 Tax=Nocardioides sp. TaxID=35761 RepID=UPI002CD2358D|nr:DeoR/GlpR family DNA-binding transcription regulator [Nocardioides sp.]HQR26717.1 DeoR/GlpR family DNA-binding transcription regulator [Nocardioides sp.]